MSSARPLTVLVGQVDRLGSARPLVPYDDRVVDFLGALSVRLLSDAEAKQYPDVISFAFWARKANIAKLKREFAETRVRLGLGTVFHIAPSNVPINFAFSYAFALLAGNANIVRVPSRDFAQTRIVCRILNAMFADTKYDRIAHSSVFVRYPHDDAITTEFSARCNARIIWGGDAAIASIRKFRIPDRSAEIVFADRYSFCVLDAQSIVSADDATRDRIVSGFYNDTFLMDQNACSSPHLIVWFGADEIVAKAKERFWTAMHRIVKSKYELQAVSAMDKYALLCRNAVDQGEAISFERHDNYLYRLDLNHLPTDVDTMRGNCGYFYEHTTQDLSSVQSIVNTKYQTLTYFGVDVSTLTDLVVSNGLSGIDRIVPVGSALDIGVIWDGLDVVRTLSRIVDFT